MMASVATHVRAPHSSSSGGDGDGDDGTTINLSSSSNVAARGRRCRVMSCVCEGV